MLLDDLIQAFISSRELGGLRPRTLDLICRQVT